MWLRPLLRKFRKDVISAGKVTVVAALAIGVLGASSYAVYAYAVPAVVHHRYFLLRSVNISSDATLERPYELASQAGLYDGTSLWQIDPARAAHALESARWVREAVVERRFPDQVNVRVYKREPVAATLGTDGVYLVDADGVVYREPHGAQTYPDLPYLTGWEKPAARGERTERLRRAMDALRVFSARRIDVSQIDVADDAVTWLYPETPAIAVKFDAHADVAKAVERLELVLANIGDGIAQVGEVDLTYPDRAIVRTAPGGLQALMSVVASGGGRSPARQENDRG